MKKHQSAEPEALLHIHERWCMNACNRYINRDPSQDNVWTLRDQAGNLSAIIVHARQSLLPVLHTRDDIPPPHFLRSLFGITPIHSLQGRIQDTVILAAGLAKMGLIPAENNDYDLMCIDRPPSGFSAAGPAGLVIRKPQYTDMDALAALQGAYEREEVLPAASDFNAAVSRLNTEKIFSQEQVMIAELGGRLIGKINTNAVTFTRYQVGGVYVDPGFRGLGIARRMAGEFIAGLIAQGRGISLFVKKSNAPARRVYQRIGFAIQGDYRITYF